MPEPELPVAKIYEQICTNIRVTDDISFKLMGLLPLISGAGLVTILLSAHPPGATMLVLLSLFAAAISLGLFRWELRNIQKCNRLITYADKFEKKALEHSDLKEAYVELPQSPQHIGKGQAEKFIYPVTILTWLVFPFLLVSPDQPEPWLHKIHLALTIIIAFATVISVFAKIKSVDKVNSSKNKRK